MITRVYCSGGIGTRWSGSPNFIRKAKLQKLCLRVTTTNGIKTVKIILLSGKTKKYTALLFDLVIPNCVNIK